MMRIFKESTAYVLLSDNLKSWFLEEAILNIIKYWNWRYLNVILTDNSLDIINSKDESEIKIENFTELNIQRISIYIETKNDYFEETIYLCIYSLLWLANRLKSRDIILSKISKQLLYKLKPTLESLSSIDLLRLEHIEEFDENENIEVELDLKCLVIFKSCYFNIEVSINLQMRKYWTKVFWYCQEKIKNQDITKQ